MNIKDKIQFKKIAEIYNIIKSQKRNTSLQIVDTDISNRLGVYYGNFSDKFIDNQDLSINRTFPNAYNRHIVIDMLSLHQVGSINITGNSYNKETGIISPYSEEIEIKEVGRVMTKKTFIGNVTIKPINNIQGTIDAYATQFMNFNNKDFTIKDIFFSFKPDRSNYNIKLSVYKVDGNGNNTIAFIKNFKNNDDFIFASNSNIGAYKRKLNLVFKGTKNEGFYIVLSAIEDIDNNMRGIRTVSLFLNIEQKL